MAFPHRPDAACARAHDASGLRILVVNGDLAARDRDAGALRLFRILEILAQEGHRLTFLGRCGFGQERAVADLVALGVDVHPVDFTRLRDLGAQVTGPDLDLAKLLGAGHFDLALLSFYDVAEQYLPLIRRYSPLTRVVIDTVDVHHVRERRGAELTGDHAALTGAEHTRRREQAVYQAADALVAVSDEDAAELEKLAPGVPRFVISTVHDQAPPTPGFEARAGLVFVGSFPHLPNVDAVLGFHRDIWPQIRSSMPAARLSVVGNKPPEPVLALGGESIDVTGWVPDVAPYLDAARVSIAPIRYGAGVKGKIGEALSRGLPVVTTSIGAEGLGLIDGEHALVADRPEDFASAVVRLHEDPALWGRIAAAGRAHIEQRLGPEAARAAVMTLLDGVVRTPFVIDASSPDAEQAIVSFARAFEPAASATLVLTVAAGDAVSAQAAFDRAAAALSEHRIDPDTVGDIQISATGTDPVLPARAASVAPGQSGRSVTPDAPVSRWRELATRSDGRRRPGRKRARAAVLVHALGDAAALTAQMNELARADLSDDVEVVVAADAAGPELESVLGALGDARVIRGTGSLGRHQAWQLGALATSAPFVVALAPLALPAPGFLEALLAPLSHGAALAGPVVAGAAGLRIAADGSLWPRRNDSDGTLDALALDCLAGSRELFADGLPSLARGEGHVEAQLGRWAAAQGGIELAADARVERLRVPDATVIVCTRNRADELPDCIAALLASGARDVVIVDNGSTDDTGAVAAELAERSGGVVRVVSEERAGLCHARNAGAAAARHDLLLYIDDDARPAPGWATHLAWALSRPGVVNAGGPISALWPPDRTSGWPGRDLEPLLSVLDLGDAERRLVPPDVVYGANWAVRREALYAVGGFDPAFGPGPGQPINGDEVSVAWRLHDRGAGATIYSPGAAVGHRITPARLNEEFLLHRALCVGVERPRHAYALGHAGHDRLLSRAQGAARQLIASAPMDGELSVAAALERISRIPAALVHQVQAAIALGELAASALLLGEDEVLLGDLRLRLQRDSLLRGVLTPE